eukprot:GEMP01129208.1.p2 GENE.GEMP01129208.1~~GEMP01129208.1.p2  ORF type:complete len:143 (+),score=26.26 GEMP01129208.1:21-449(+)
MWSLLHCAAKVSAFTAHSAMGPLGTALRQDSLPFMVRGFATVFTPKPMLTFGVRRSKAYKDSKTSARKSAVKARKLEEQKGMLLDPRKCLQMELKRNSGIGWYRSFQIVKNLEMHKRGKGPPIDARMRDKITQIANVIKAGK